MPEKFLPLQCLIILRYAATICERRSKTRFQLPLCEPTLARLRPKNRRGSMKVLRPPPDFRHSIRVNEEDTASTCTFENSMRISNGCVNLNSVLVMELLSLALSTPRLRRSNRPISDKPSDRPPTPAVPRPVVRTQGNAQVALALQQGYH